MIVGRRAGRTPRFRRIRIVHESGTPSSLLPGVLYWPACTVNQEGQS